MTDREAVPAADGTDRERRRFLLRLWQGLGVLAALEFVGAVLFYLRPSKGSGASRKAIIEVGPATEFAPSSVTAFPRGRFFLARLADGGFLALSPRCTHLGCVVSWDASGQAFACPCHSSSFDLRGEVTGPPARRALDLYAVTIAGGAVRVDTGRRIERGRFEPGQVTYL
jgi:cytochrome b6-f complex iron-sulfur subunit